MVTFLTHTVKIFHLTNWGTVYGIQVKYKIYFIWCNVFSTFAFVGLSCDTQYAQVIILAPNCLRISTNKTNVCDMF